MRYPTLSKAQVQAIASALLSGQAPDIEKEVKWSGEGEQLDLEPIKALGSKLLSDLATFERGDEARDRDLFEGRAAGELHALLKDLPPLVLDDPGFWRYLTVAHFWPIVVWREASTFQTDSASYQKYIDGTNPSECVLLRMFLRAQVACLDGDYSLASAIPSGTDFWRSHVIRVRTSASPVVSQAFARTQAEDRMVTDDLRAFARRLNRIRSNVVVDVYDSSEAEALLRELREST